MNSAAYVDQKIQELKTSGIPLSDAAWQAALECVGWPYIYGDRGQYCTPSQRKAVYNKHPDQTGLVDKCQVLKDDAENCYGCKWYPNGSRVRSFDCRGFTYWILKQIYGWELMGGGATSQWNTESNWKAKGTIDTIPDDVLVCLFYTQKGNPKVMQHTGFGYKGSTIECGNGVTYTKVRSGKWTHWAIPAFIDGDVPAPDPDRKPTLRKGDQGSYVTLAQTELIQKGYDCGKWGADGKFGAATETAVKKFQKDHGLDADGVIGPDTWAALEDPEYTTESYKVTIPSLSYEEAEGLVAKYKGATMEKERW